MKRARPPRARRVEPTARPGARAAALSILASLGEAHGSLPDRLAEADATLDERDRRFLRALVLGTLRHRGALDYHLTPLLERALSRTERTAVEILRLGAYQLLQMRVPAHAAVGESVALAHSSVPRLSGFVNAVLRRLAREGPRPFPDPNVQPLDWLTSAGSLPAWLAQRWLSALGPAAAVARARASLDPPDPAFRLNPRVADAWERVLAAGIEPIPLPVPGSFRAVGRGLWDLATAGVVYVQDQGSQLVAHLAAGTGLHLDACAAPGGKATLMADLVGTRGLVVAAEWSQPRLVTLASLVRAWGPPNVRCVAADALHPPFRQVFDVVLLDAPCSGLGTLARNPDLRWRLRPEDLPRQAERQLALLRSVAALVRPRGLLVYSVCSLEPEETDHALARFLGEWPAFAAEPLPSWAEPFTEGHRARLLPERDGGDGFYCVALRRAGL